MILLLKRFESSVRAVMISIENKIALFEYFDSVLKTNRIVSPKQLNKIMLKWNTQNMEGDGDDDELRDEFFMNEIRDIPVLSAGRYDVESMKRDIGSDLKHLRRYRDSLRNMPKFDKKAEAVADMILRDEALEKEGRKVLVFTEYTATAIYVRDFLETKFDDKNVSLITGSVKKSRRPQIIKAFSPKANTAEGEDRPKETDILVSTEVLSEGQNLQDCNYVINYDLPWNPMRIVQRIGRVDRLTSTHDTVHSRECFPDTKLDDLLQLVGNLMNKIGHINDAIGLDEDLLGQEASPKNFGETTASRIRALAGSEDSGKVAEGIERESDLMPARTPINEIIQHIKKAGIMKMEEFSMGRRSGKTGEGRKAVLAYLRETASKRRFYSVVFDYATGKAKIVDDMEAIVLARCGEDTPIHLPMDADGHGASFRHLVEIDGAAREAIAMRNSSDIRIANDLKSKPKKSEKTIDKIRDIIANEIIGGNLPVADGQDADKVLKSTDLRHWNDDMESLLDDYENRRDIRSLVGELRRIRGNIGTDVDDAIDAEEDTGKLVLVGALFITGSGTDAGQLEIGQYLI